jgi:transcriptional regulator with XRE-family HTH domain
MSGVQAQKLVDLRTKKGWTQRLLAEKAGIQERTVQRAEKEGKASLETIRRVAQALGVEVSFLQRESSSRGISSPGAVERHSSHRRDDGTFVAPEAEVLQRLYVLWTKDPKERLGRLQLLDGLSGSPVTLRSLVPTLYGKGWIRGPGQGHRLSPQGVLAVERLYLAPRALIDEMRGRRHQLMRFLLEFYEKDTHLGYTWLVRELQLTQRQYEGHLEVLWAQGWLEGGAAYPHLKAGRYEEAKSLLVCNATGEDARGSAES